ncbi:MAG TPA: ABA4-like family protein [Vicinamibacterales bacterium]|nr:ABA4-like family protein [Vicinamibacterales bacterium]
MTLEQTFSLASSLAAVSWLFLLLLPKRPIAVHFAGLFVPMVLSAMYLYFIATHMRGAEGGFGSLDDVALLFQTREMLLAGWIHYLAFDLFIGAWEVRDSQQHGIPHLVVIPCLIMTFMLGPIGLLFYIAIRSAKTRSVAV